MHIKKKNRSVMGVYLVTKASILAMTIMDMPSQINKFVSDEAPQNIRIGAVLMSSKAMK